VPHSAPVDGFSLAYERAGSGPPVVLLHGWPGDRTDYEAGVPRLAPDFEVVVPDLRGCGASDKHPEPPAEAYSAAAQARSVVGLLDELGLERPLIAGYDIGSRIAQAIARDAPERVRALVVSPPLPGAGERVLTPDTTREFWYQSFHQLSLIEEVLDGDRAAVRAYLAHFWSHWSGPAFEPGDERLDHLADAYGEPGAMTASVAWYRAGSGMVASSLAETEPEPEYRIARRRPSCGRSTTRSSRASGRIASTRSSAPPSSSSSAAPGTSRPSRRRRRSPPRSARAGPPLGSKLPGLAPSSRSRAARRARSRPAPSAPPTPPGARAP
jgi:pimeloyl-ACP methyl ester carboxylesterase